MRRNLACLLGVILLAGCGSGAPRAQSTRAQTAPRPSAAEASASGLRPRILQWRIPFPQSRKAEMAAYSKRHYGEASYILSDPHVIVEHYAEASTARAVYDTFAPDNPDTELHELPNVCSHFVIDSDGTIYQLVALDIRCRHTVGLDWTAIAIEDVGFSDSEILGDRPELRSSLELTRWLRCRFGIPLGNVIGHSESLSSPYHRELDPALRSQTHGDWTHPDMVRYRHLLAGFPCR